MLYKDSEQRKKDIILTAQLFKEYGYTKTSSEILEYCKILDGTTIPSDFINRLNSTFDTLEKDFSESLPIEKDYRKRCFRDIKSIIVNAGRKSSFFKQSLLIILPLIKRMGDTRKITSSIAKGLVNIKDREIRAHLNCYTYLIIVEGLFDELARMLYFLRSISEGKTPTLKDVEKMEVWDIYNSFKTKPVFLENWEEKKHIRNAIGHAGTYYDYSKDEILFVDRDWNITLSMVEFIGKEEELEASVMAFMYVFLLLRIYDLIVLPEPYAS